MPQTRAFGATAALVLISAVMALLLAGPARAADPLFMALGGPVKRPIGHHLFCARHPTECQPRVGTALQPVSLDPALMARVAAVNLSVNATVAPASDRELYNVEEHWVVAGTRGDCEDYALLKRERLMAIGISPANLLLTVVRKRNGEGHAVLTLRTVGGDFILDNLDWRVRAFSETPYNFVKRQALDDPGRWVAIEAGADPLVGALSR